MILNGKHTQACALGLAVALGTIALATTFNARAQFVVVDPTNYIQNFMTQLRAVQSNLNEAKQIATEIQQLKTMAQNTASLTGGNWKQSNDVLNRLDGLMQQGEAIAVSAEDYDAVFRSRFPSYKPKKNYAESYRKWSETSRDSVFGAMRVANIQVKGMNSEDQAMDALRSAASSSTGQKAALDAGNQIAMAQINQMQQLRELMVAQMQSQGTHIAAQEHAKATKAASIQDATRFKSVRDGYKGKPVEITRPRE